MLEQIIIFGALTFGIAIACWFSVQKTSKSRSSAIKSATSSSFAQALGRALVVFLAVLGAFFILERTFGLRDEARLSPFHVAYGAALITFLRALFSRQSNKALQRAEER